MATFRMFAASAVVLLVLYLIAQKFWVKGGVTEEKTEMEVKRGQSIKLLCSFKRKLYKRYV